IASTTASADGSPKCSGTRRWRAVAGPRPSSPRSAAPTAASPMWRPPPQSPDSGPSAGKRAWAPPGPTPAQFMPAPTTTTTPQVRSVPARSTANTATGASLRLCWENKETFLTKANLGIIAATVCRARGARMGLKIAVVGAVSTYTPELVEGFAARSERLPMDELVLLDPDEQRLEVVGGLARRMLARAGFGGRLELTGRLEEALDGADFVIVQLRVGGQAQRRIDETLPLEFGCIGQETTGPGGFAKALRTVPVVLDIAEEAARRAAPGAWLVDFTNPVGIVTQALLDQGHRAIGLCNVAIGFQRRLAAQLVVEPHRVELGHVGLNHLSWLRAVRVDGVDPLPPDPLPPELLGLVQQMKAYERLTVAAARGGDRALALEALLANPLVADYRVAVPLLDALLRASRGHLPSFFPG